MDIMVCYCGLKNGPTSEEELQETILPLLDERLMKTGANLRRTEALMSYPTYFLRNTNAIKRKIIK
jgi:hypothetical protein